MKAGIIAITGTPGTGKTSLARELAKLLKAGYVDVELLIRQKGLAEAYDKKRKTFVVDESKLSKAILSELKPSRLCVVDSHMSHFLPARRVSLCIVARCSLRALKKRLEKKGYRPAKVRENLDAEIFEVCLQEARERDHKVIEVDTTKSRPLSLAKRILPRVLAALKGRR